MMPPVSAVRATPSCNVGYTIGFGNLTLILELRRGDTCTQRQAWAAVQSLGSDHSKQADRTMRQLKALLRATSEEEQAVSVTVAGPVQPNTYEMRPVEGERAHAM